MQEVPDQPQSDQQQPQLSQTIKLQEPSSQKYQPTIFINYCNGYIGSELVETFRNDHIIQINPNLIVGTLDPNDSTVPPEGVQIINIKDRKSFNAALNSSDLVLFQIKEQNKTQFEQLIKTIRYLSPEKKRTIICLSSFLGWNSDNDEILATLKRTGDHDYRKQLQNWCMNITHHNSSAKGYVIYKGIVYGRGQQNLFPMFKKSILQSKKGLDVRGKGNNILPMIHIQDLCSIVENISKTKPQQKYWLASNGANQTQIDVITAISNSLGEGIVNTKPIENIYPYELPPQLKLNLKTSKTNIPIEWHSSGFVNSIGEIIFQFNQYRGIRTNKIFITGMPVSGKTNLAQILSKHYNLPLISTKQTVQIIRNIPNQLGQQIHKILEQTRMKMIEDQQKIFDEARKKKKPKKGEPVQQFDSSKIFSRLSQQNLVRVFRERLSQQDCKNKGYVLDGFPKTSFQAQQLFKDRPQSLPNCCFYIESTQEQIRDRVKKLPLQVTKDTHWTEEATVRRLGAHKTHVDGNKNILQFIKNNNIDFKKVPFNLSEPKNELVSFVERNGPMGLTLSEPLPIEQPKNQQQSAPVQQQQKNEKQQDSAFDIQKLKENQKKILDQKSKPIRQYLIDNVIPQLTEGLIEVCRQTPKNPLDFLINFLEEKQNIDQTV